MTTRIRALFAIIVFAIGFVSITLARVEGPPTGGQMTKAADAFLASLTSEQKSVGMLAMDSPQRVDWHFIPKPERKGLQVRDMNEAQRKLAHALLSSSLSKVGYGKATTIMEMENLLKELEKGKTGTPLRDSLRYYFTVFGKPSDDGQWGLSIEGHHLSLNFVMEHGEVASFSPLALCSNPATVMTDSIPSIKKGQRLLGAQEQLAFDLLGELSPKQKQQAIIAEKALAEVRAAGEAQPPQTAAEGIAVKDLNAAQQAMLKKLINSYLENVPDDIAENRRQAVHGETWNNVRFAWAGAVKPGIGHYYRIQGNSFLIEFVNTQPDAAGNPANHIHCVWRNPQGDFGVPVAAK